VVVSVAISSKLIGGATARVLIIRMLRSRPSARHSIPSTPLGSGLRRLRRWCQQRAFAALYGPGATFYDRFTEVVFAGEWQRWQRLVLPLLPRHGVILELGAGTGRLAAEEALPGRTWVAVDRSSRMLAHARSRARPGGLWFIRADARALPLADCAVDAVVMTFPAGSMLGPAAARELRRVLRPHGDALIVLTGELTPVGWRRRWRGLALRAFYGQTSEVAAPFVLDGFLGTTAWHATAYGRGLIYRGQPMITTGGCSPPPAAAGEPA